MSDPNKENRGLFSDSPFSPQSATLPDDIYDQIEQLKLKENATILAHYYQDGEIQEIADHTGDSLALARTAKA